MSGQLAVALLVIAAAGALVLAGAAARWVVGHRGRIRAGLAWRFLGRRFAPGEAAGLTLTLGVVMVLTLGVGFGQLLDNVLDSDGVTVADQPVLGFLAAHREPWLVTAARLITDAGSPVGAAVTGLGLAAVLARLRRMWLPLVVIVLGGAGIAAINTLVKRLVSRDRPSRVSALLGAHGFSFPSGHTTGTTVVWLLCAWMTGRWVVSGRAGRAAVWAGSLLMIISVGVTRVYLGVHFPSDVLAGWVLGAAWALTVALVVTVWEQSRRVPGTDPNAGINRCAGDGGAEGGW